jgi:hypothetical protein
VTAALLTAFRASPLPALVRGCDGRTAAVTDIPEHPLSLFGWIGFYLVVATIIRVGPSAGESEETGE